MRQAALLLNTSQTVIENEYYMVDLPEILEAKSKEKTDELITQIMIRLATNQRFMPDEQYQKFMNGIVPKGNQGIENQFNREKFEELRLLTNMGINRQ